MLNFILYRISPSASFWLGRPMPMNSPDGILLKDYEGMVGSLK